LASLRRQLTGRDSEELELSPPAQETKEMFVTLGTILLVILVLMLIGAIPQWPHSRNWGYGPSGGLGLVLVVVVVLLLMGRL
jgi:Na+/melibiose symporter-like transporter